MCPIPIIPLLPLSPGHQWIFVLEPWLIQTCWEPMEKVASVNPWPFHAPLRSPPAPFIWPHMDSFHCRGVRKPVAQHGLPGETSWPWETDTCYRSWSCSASFLCEHSIVPSCARLHCVFPGNSNTKRQQAEGVNFQSWWLALQWSLLSSV